MILTKVLSVAPHFITWMNSTQEQSGPDCSLRIFSIVCFFGLFLGPVIMQSAESETRMFTSLHSADGWVSEIATTKSWAGLTLSRTWLRQTVGKYSFNIPLAYSFDV